ncbi:hypothetical protein [Streptomyces scabiei]|uniref:hypothetical protein n=1 Tax=Streptomyces scabiei TaxID=1930 RepID=UPI0029A3B70A|nr:hypothetical protein [Streptomyces scabiei]MDX3520576.1 hypothetical protein [Streptomyces scabiei]
MSGRGKEPNVRPCPHRGEIFFDSVEAPLCHTLSARDACRRGHAETWSSAGAAMGRIMTGLVRPAFDMALGHVHERRQGCAPPAGHRPVPYRLSRTGSQLKAVRAVSRRPTEYTPLAPARHPYRTARSTAMGADQAFQVADEVMTAGSQTDPHRTEGHRRGDH